jgi:hypothetical protein
MKTKSTSTFVALVLFLLTASTAGASVVKIADNYIGGGPTSSSYYGRDVIGENSLFNIDYMTVDLQPGLLVVDIHSSYFDNIGAFDTQMGDLFVSNNGWHPYGSAPYKDDYAATGGESWEYAVDLTQNGGNKVAKLYNTSDGTTSLSYADPTRYIYRAGQETTFQPNGGATALDTGTWSIQLDPLGQDHVLHVSVPVPMEFTSDYLGFHWAMTCGNDVIEGGIAPVPEVTTLLLMGLGVGGIAALRKKRKKALEAQA